ncbi:glycosyltransferase family 2 protein [Winogradskyella sp. A3E31]|uniref:glycosyltransferase family 2 protein n=1 Tax=Winogradskyella sp. A3E31 TaxID=3349637 RepID=UPI00398B905F
MTNLVSIIIPVFNREYLIAETLNSILTQTYKNWECLVIDDDSTDNTEKVVKAFVTKDERFIYYKRPVNRPKGANACRNYGLELAKGDFVNWFDSDDIMHPEKIEKQLHLLQNTDYEFCVCQTLKFKKTIDKPRGFLSEYIVSENPLEDFITKKIVWLTQAPLFKKDLLLRNNFTFDESLQAGQEWDLFARILFMCNTYGVINEPLVYLRKHKDSISGDKTINEKWHYTKARYNIYKDYLPRLSPRLMKYFNNYFKRMYCEFLREGELDKASYLLKNVFYKTKNIPFKMRVYLVLAKLSFKYFRQGEFFLRPMLDDHNFYKIKA